MWTLRSGWLLALVLTFVGALGSSRDAVRAMVEEPRAGEVRASNLTPPELRALYFDLYGRPPLEAERAKWLGHPRATCVEAALASAEAWQHWLEEQLYYFFLIDNFRPETERIAAMPEALASGKLDARTATHRIAISPSFDHRNPGADTFVTVVMEQMNGIEVQKNARELEIGKGIYDGRPGMFLGRSGSSQADIVEIALHDVRFAQTFLAREYQRIVRADPDPKPMAEWTRRFQRDPMQFRAILAEWFASAAWNARVQRKSELPNRLWARALHVDLLGRLPDEEEARRMRSALDGLSDAGPLRSVFARVLIDSGRVTLPTREAIGEPASWIGEQFRTLLGREPSASELAVFVDTFEDPACRPATVVYAIVSHPEYQTY